MREEIKYFPCQIPALNLHCFGCCCSKLGNRDFVLEEIEENTKEFEEVKFKSMFRMLHFRDRLSENNWVTKESGVCSNVVKFKSGVYGCPIHPLINSVVERNEYKYPNEKFDLRIGHCDVDYECGTFKWINKRKETSEGREEIEELFDWIRENYDDSYEYSYDNGEDLLVKKFLKSKMI